MHTAQIIIASSGALLGMMLIVALVRRPGGLREGNRMLAMALACNLCLLLLLIAMRVGINLTAWSTAPITFFYNLGSIMLLGYVRTLTTPGFALQASHLAHLVPPLALMVFVLLINDSKLSTGELLESARGGWPPNSLALTGICMYLLQVAYFGRALLELRTHRKCVPEQFSYTDGVTLTWLRLLIGLSLVLSVTALAIALIRLIPGMELWPRSYVSMTAILVTYYLIAFKGLSQPALFEPAAESGRKPADQESREGAVISAEVRPQENALPPEVESHYWGELEAAMERDRPYLNSKLRIADLAIQLDMQVHHLSQTINRRAQESFSDYINRYRVEEAKSQLGDTAKPITTIAFDAGFNSESAFYRHFKHFTGKTPRQFRTQLPPELASQTP